VPSHSFRQRGRQCASRNKIDHHSGRDLFWILNQIPRCLRVAGARGEQRQIDRSRRHLLGQRREHPGGITKVERASRGHGAGSATGTCDRLQPRGISAPQKQHAIWCGIMRGERRPQAARCAGDQDPSRVSGDRRRHLMLAGHASPLNRSSRLNRVWFLVHRNLTEVWCSVHAIDGNRSVLEHNRTCP
jgi:hypothetical protein